MTNGYVVVDCKGLNLLAENAQTIAGLYDRVKAAMQIDKLILATNMIWGTGKNVTPVPVFAIDFGDDGIICTASTLQICISKQSAVTIVNMAPAN